MGGAEVSGWEGTRELDRGIRVNSRNAADLVTRAEDARLKTRERVIGSKQ